MKEKLGSIPEVTKQISDMTSEFRLLDQETMKGLEPSKPYETFQSEPTCLTVPGPCQATPE